MPQGCDWVGLGYDVEFARYAARFGNDRTAGSQVPAESLTHTMG